MTLVRSRTLGDMRIHALEGGTQRLDGGAMFGVVPKPLWERRIPADERNRIPLAMRCLLVETPDALVLIDNGCGNKENDRFRDIYGIENAPSAGSRHATQLEEALEQAGFAIDDVDVVIDTHLHFDHAGGNTRLVDGAVELSFPRARYVARRGEWEWAHLRNERIQASYLPHNFDPVMDAGRLELVDDDVEIVPGISVLRTPGHTPHHQSVLVRSGGDTACFLADVIPTSAHLPLPWIMGYDVEPLVTLESKRTLLKDAQEQQWLLVFEHDPVTPWGRLDPNESRPTLITE
ncbi:MAG TPA: MBL fold metallo-hydrolase [Longimicrobiales bacterium]|nr:MBL fold metallo-hydrolase [Longimicrobiales bacterium]